MSKQLFSECYSILLLIFFQTYSQGPGLHKCFISVSMQVRTCQHVLCILLYCALSPTSSKPPIVTVLLILSAVLIDGCAILWSSWCEQLPQLFRLLPRKTFILLICICAIFYRIIKVFEEVYFLCSMCSMSYTRGSSAT